MGPKPHLPYHDLDRFKDDFIARTTTRVISWPAYQGATALGLGEGDIEECINLLDKRSHTSGHGNFIKTNHYTYKDKNQTPNPQDVYHICYEEMDIYIKLGRSPIGEPAVVSFKEYT